MNGTAIRAYELARVLQSNFDVTLGATGVGDMDLAVPCVSYRRHDGSSLRPHLEGADVVVAQPQWPLAMRELRRSRARLIFDLYAPDPLETLEYLAGSRRAVRRLVGAFTVDRVAEAFRIGHGFLAASEKQRDFWLGAMLAERLIGPESYDRDPSFDSVIAPVPFGIPATPPSAGAEGIRSRFPQIGAGDEIVLWNGGIWNWLDPETAIRAVAALAQRRPGVRLVFMGGSDQPAGQRAARRARDVAAELGVAGDTVLFNDGWVPYGERGAWLLEANCALSCHVSHLETRFAFRTRLLDCIWAGLPVVCTEGDALAEEIERHDLGFAVPEEDPGTAAAAIEAVLERGKESYAGGLAEAAGRYRWDRVAAPLVDLTRAEEPRQPIGASVPRRPGHTLRTAGYSALRTVVNRAGFSGDGLGIRRT
jgi:hypothetical protein